jgi:hypothetical protein
MNTNIINIDSKQSFNGNSYDNFSLKTDYFPEIKNVVSIEISDINFFYTSTGTHMSTGDGLGNGITTPSMQFSNIFYRFLTINDIEQITYNTTANNMNSYTTKLLRNINSNTLVPQPRLIEFNQPINIGNLNFSWFKEDGTKATNIADLIDNSESAGDERFTFTLTIKSLQNSTLKNYNEMFNFSPEVLQRLAYVKIIEDKDKKDYTKEDNMGIPDNNYVPNTNEPTPYNFKDNSQQSSITGDYSNQTQEINNNVNYLSNGNRLQYNYNGFINGN